MKLPASIQPESRTSLRMWLTASLIAGTVFMVSSGSSAARADETTDAPATGVADVRLTSKTFGGRQFWADVRFLHGWRVQKNIITAHFRLLDPDDNRHATGTLDECNRKLDDIQRNLRLPAMHGRAVVLIHGLIRSSKSFHAMRTALQNEDFVVVPFDYPSTRVPIEDSAVFLHNVIESLGDDVTEIDVVAHSMGGIVLRSFLQHYEEPRLHRAVMLGVPNRGAEIASRFQSNPLFKAIYGPAGGQLANGDAGIVDKLPVPAFEFGIIAGGKGTPNGYNPLLNGDNDSTVTVASTRLAGATDFLLVPVLHSFLMASEEPIKATLHYLEHGCFCDDRPAQPIPPDDPASTRQDARQI